jgi:chitodextrinase
VQIGTLQTSRGGSFNDYDIKPGNSYTYNISAYDAQMNESVLSSSVTEFYPSDSSTISTKDQTAPTAPYNLTTRAVSASKIDFSWPPSTDNVGVAGYKVYRDEKEISTTKGTSYSDTGLQPGSAYSYYIRAFDVAGNTSEKSSYLTEFTQNSTTVTATKDTQTPSYPPNLVARAVSSSQMDISWSPSTDNIGVAGYIIYRNNVEIGRTTNLSYRDNGLSAGTDYSYNVKAYDAAGNQSYMSNSVTEFTSSNQTTINNTRDTSAPSSPSNLTTRSVSTTKIEFSWSPSTDNVGVVGYKIYRDDREISSITGTSYSDNGLQPGSAYSYYVKAYDSAGNLSQRSSYLTEFTQTAVIINNAPSDTQAPSYPPNLNIRAISSSQIEISWSPSTDNVGVIGYIIYRNNTEISRTTGTSYRHC